MVAKTRYFACVVVSGYENDGERKLVTGVGKFGMSLAIHFSQTQYEKETVFYFPICQ